MSSVARIISSQADSLQVGKSGFTVYGIDFEGAKYRIRIDLLEQPVRGSSKRKKISFKDVKLPNNILERVQKISEIINTVAKREKIPALKKFTLSSSEFATSALMNSSEDREKGQKRIQGLTVNGMDARTYLEELRLDLLDALAGETGEADPSKIMQGLQSALNSVPGPNGLRWSDLCSSSAKVPRPYSAFQHLTDSKPLQPAELRESQKVLGWLVESCRKGKEYLLEPRCHHVHKVPLRRPCKKHFLAKESKEAAERSAWYLIHLMNNQYFNNSLAKVDLMKNKLANKVSEIVSY